METKLDKIQTLLNELKLAGGGMSYKHLLENLPYEIQTILDKEYCPNPQGKEGVCYAWDKFEGECGCWASQCEYYEQGMFDHLGVDPLPGLTAQLKEKAENGSEGRKK